MIFSCIRMSNWCYWLRKKKEEACSDYVSGFADVIVKHLPLKADFFFSNI